VTWIVNYLIASIPHNNLPHNKLYVITIFNWLPPPNFFLCRFCWVQAAKVVFTGWMTCSHGKCQNRKLKAPSVADPNQWPGLILSSFITRLLTRSIAPFTPAVWQNSSRKEITEYNFCLTGNLSKLLQIQHTRTHTHTCLMALSPGLPGWAGTRKVKPIWILLKQARDSEWQWHQLGHMQVCTSLQTDNHASTPPLSFLQAGCPSCRPTNSVKALKAVNRLKAVKADSAWSQNENRTTVFFKKHPLYVSLWMWGTTHKVCNRNSNMTKMNARHAKCMNDYFTS